MILAMCLAACEAEGVRSSVTSDRRSPLEDDANLGAGATGPLYLDRAWVFGRSGGVVAAWTGAFVDGEVGFPAVCASGIWGEPTADQSADWCPECDWTASVTVPEWSAGGARYGDCDPYPTADYVADNAVGHHLRVGYAAEWGEFHDVVSVAYDGGTPSMVSASDLDPVYYWTEVASDGVSEWVVSWCRLAEFEG